MHTLTFICVHAHFVPRKILDPYQKNFGPRLNLINPFNFLTYMNPVPRNPGNLADSKNSYMIRSGFPLDMRCPSDVLFRSHIGRDVPDHAETLS